MPSIPLLHQQVEDQPPKFTVCLFRYYFYQRKNQVLTYCDFEEISHDESEVCSADKIFLCHHFRNYSLK